MRIFLLTIAALIFAGGQLQAQSTILFEDFEDSIVTYTGAANNLSNIASRDYYGVLAPDTLFPPVDVTYSNQQGNGYFGAQDTDNAGPSGTSNVILNWNGVNITDYDNLDLSWYVGEDTAGDGNQDWDTTSSFRIAVQIDGGGFTDIFAIESEIGGDGNQTNEVPRVDTDFDGIGDGTLITDFMSQFSSLIGNGTTLDIQVTIEDLDTGDEDIAFDSLLLQGDFTGVPEPATFGILALGLGFVSLRRRRA